MREFLTIGIDPGFTGGICVLNRDGSGSALYDMPVVPGQKGRTELNLPELYRCIAAYYNGFPSDLWMEKVSARPGQGVTSMFRFGQQVGALEMAAAAHRHRTRYVTPAVWKAHFGLSADKGVARGLAIKLFPEWADKFVRVKDDGRAEAALIARYGWETGK